MKKNIKYVISQIKDKKIYIIVALLIFALDLLSKYLVDKYLQQEEIKKVFGDMLMFIYTRNYGVAFGFLNNLPDFIAPIMPNILKVIVFVAMTAVFIFMLNIDKKKQPLTMIGFTMILGGAMGNFFDRVFRGYVTDFISMGFTRTFRFPYHYNVADAAITIGIVIIIIGMLVFKEDKVETKEDKN